MTGPLLSGRAREGSPLLPHCKHRSLTATAVGDRRSLSTCHYASSADWTHQYQQRVCVAGKAHWAECGTAHWAGGGAALSSARRCVSTRQPVARSSSVTGRALNEQRCVSREGEATKLRQTE